MTRVTRADVWLKYFFFSSALFFIFYATRAQLTLISSGTTSIIFLFKSEVRVQIVLYVVYQG